MEPQSLIGIVHLSTMFMVVKYRIFMRASSETKALFVWSFSVMNPPVELVGVKGFSFQP